MNSFKLAYLNLSRRKVSTSIALIAIAVSVATGGILLRLYLLSDSRFSTFGRGGDAVIGAKAGGIEILLGSLNLEGPYPGFLPFKLFESLRAQTNVKFEDGAVSQPNYIRMVIPLLYFAKFQDFRVIGTDDTFIHRPDASDSPTLQMGQWPVADQEVTLGADVAAQNALNVGDQILVDPWTSPEKISLGKKVSLKVVGVLSSTHSVWDRALYTNISTAQRTLQSFPAPGGPSIWNADVLNYFLVYLQPNGLKPLEDLVNKRTVGQVISIEDQKMKLQELTGTGRQLGFLMTALIILLGGLSVASMMITRFEAMTMQLAVLRAIGYEKKDVGGWLLWEGLLLGLTACVVGALLDLILFPIFRSMLGSALPAAEIVGSSVFQSAPVWGMAILGTILAVFIPLIRLYRQDIHFSLRGM